MAAAGCHADVLPAAAAGHAAVVKGLGPPFEARYDRVWFTTNTLHLAAVKEPRSAGQAATNEPLPNSWSASDHLPLVVEIELR